MMDSVEPLISIIIPVYNGEVYIDNLLKDFQGQTYDSFEVIVVDDGSTDGTRDIVRGIADVDTRFVLLTQSHGGVSAARNLALGCCNGGCICFCDADDRVEPDYLKLMVTALMLGGTGCAVCGWDRGPGSMAMLPGERSYGRSGMHSLIGDGAFFTALWNKMFTRSAISDGDIFILFDERLAIGEDEEWLARVFSRRDEFLWVPEVLYHWVPRQGSATYRRFRLDERTVTEVVAKRRVYNLLEDGDLGDAAYCSYYCAMKRLIVASYRTRKVNPLYDRLFDEFMAASKIERGGGLALAKARFISWLVRVNAPAVMVEWIDSLSKTRVACAS